MGDKTCSGFGAEPRSELTKREINKGLGRPKSMAQASLEIIPMTDAQLAETLRVAERELGRVFPTITLVRAALLEAAARLEHKGT